MGKLSWSPSSSTMPEPQNTPSLALSSAKSVTSPNKLVLSPVMLALQKGHLEIALELTKAGALVPPKDFHEEASVPQLAHMYGISEVALEEVIKQRTQILQTLTAQQQKMLNTGIQLFNISAKKVPTTFRIQPTFPVAFGTHLHILFRACYIYNPVDYLEQVLWRELSCSFTAKTLTWYKLETI